MRGPLLQRWRTLTLPPAVPAAQNFNLAYVGPLYDGWHCWEAEESAQALFLEIAPLIKGHLESCLDAIPCSDWVFYSMYSVGKSPTTANLTLMFFSDNVQYAKKVRNAVKESGMLKNYPGIKTAHFDRDPGLENLKQLAVGQSTKKDYPAPATEVYYDPSKPICPYGMPVFVQHISETTSSMRTVTANIHRFGNRIFFLTVFHAFANHTALAPAKREQCGDDGDVFGIDSDAEDDLEDDLNIAITSIGSRSPDTLSDHSLSEGDFSGKLSARSLSFSDCSTQPAASPPPASLTGMQNSEVLSDKLTPYTARSRFYAKREAVPCPDLESLALLGTLASWSLENDWALVEITNEDVLAMIADEDISQACASQETQETAPGLRSDVQITTRTASGGDMTGTLMCMPSYSRLPYSTSFQEVFKVRLDGPLADGDCGSSIRDARTGQSYGLIVGGCEQTGIAYIIGAGPVLGDLETRHIPVQQATSSGFEFEELGRLPSDMMEDISLGKTITDHSAGLPPSPVGCAKLTPEEPQSYEQGRLGSWKLPLYHLYRSVQSLSLVQNIPNWMPNVSQSIHSVIGILCFVVFALIFLPVLIVISVWYLSFYRYMHATHRNEDGHDRDMYSRGGKQRLHKPHLQARRAAFGLAAIALFFFFHGWSTILEPISTGNFMASFIASYLPIVIFLTLSIAYSWKINGFDPRHWQHKARRMKGVVPTVVSYGSNRLTGDTCEAVHRRGQLELPDKERIFTLRNGKAILEWVWTWLK